MPWIRFIFGAIIPCPTKKKWYYFQITTNIPKSTWSLVSSRKHQKCVLSCNSLPTIPVPFTPTPLLYCLPSSTVVEGQVPMSCPLTSRPLRPNQIPPPPLFTQGQAACRWWLQSTKCFMLVKSRGHLSHCRHNVSPRHPVSLFFCFKQATYFSDYVSTVNIINSSSTVLSDGLKVERFCRLHLHIQRSICVTQWH